MKLMCISREPQMYNQTNIEVGKVYDIGRGDDRWGMDDKKLVFVVLEDGSSQEYPKQCFISLSDYRNGIIDDILGDG